MPSHHLLMHLLDNKGLDYVIRHVSLESGYVIGSISLESIRFYINSLMLSECYFIENLAVFLFSETLDC
jgi:hypothetical protein